MHVSPHIEFFLQGFHLALGYFSLLDLFLTVCGKLLDQYPHVLDASLECWYPLLKQVLGFFCFSGVILCFADQGIFLGELLLVVLDLVKSLLIGTILILKPRLKSFAFTCLLLLLVFESLDLHL